MKNIIIIIIAILTVSGLSGYTYKKFITAKAAIYKLDIPATDVTEIGDTAKIAIKETPESLDYLAQANMAFMVIKTGTNALHSPVEKIVDAYTRESDARVDLPWDKEKHNSIRMVVALEAARKANNTSLELRVQEMMVVKNTFTKLYVEASGQDMPGEASIEVDAQELTERMAIPVVARILREGAGITNF